MTGRRKDPVSVAYERTGQYVHGEVLRHRLHSYVHACLYRVGSYEKLLSSAPFVGVVDARQWLDQRIDDSDAYGSSDDPLPLPPIGPRSLNLTERDDREYDPPQAHEGFWTTVDGEAAHILGDPNMDEKTLNALHEVIRAARRAIDDGSLP